MAELERFEYGDPLQILIRREEATCRGCKHESKVEAFGKTLWVCTAKDAKGKRRSHGRRCKAFKGQE